MTTETLSLAPLSIPLDRIYIEALTVFTQIGVYDWEKSIQQKLSLDLEIAWFNQPAGESDNVENCLNYAQIIDVVLTFLRNNHYQLIEAVAEQTAKELFKCFPIEWLKIKVSKPDAIAQAKNVAIEIVRLRSHYAII